MTLFFNQQGQAQLLEGYTWHANFVENPEVNAWCMAGGQIVVYTGILPYTLDDTGLAVVLGHEIAHAVARHGAERMSQALLVEMDGVALSEAMAKNADATRNMYLALYGAGSQVGFLLPHDRVQETEADRWD